MTELRFEGHERRAYRLVLNHCPPSLNVERELELTKLATTALIIGLDEDWVASQLASSSAKVILEQIRKSIH